MKNPLRNLGGLGNIFKGGGMTGEIQSAIQGILSKIDFPVGKHDLVDKARELKAPNKVIKLLDGLTNKRYESKDEVVEETKKLH